MPSAPVKVVPYDPRWPQLFELERRELERELAPWIVGGIEHVGSTSVVGLAAKPVIDIMVGVRSLAQSRPAIDAAGRLGYVYWPYKADVMHWFCKPSDEHRTHHLHLIPFQSALWHERLAFRDLLRTNTDVARAYERLKRELAAVHEFDREAYTDGKYPFVIQALAGSRDDRGS